MLTRVLSTVSFLSLLINSTTLAAIEHFTGSTTSSYAAYYYGHLHIEGADGAIGDEVGVFDPDGVLCGAAAALEVAWYNITVYGDDPVTDTDEGAEPGDLLTFRIWDKSADQEMSAAATVTDGPCTNPLQWYQSWEYCQVDVNGFIGDLTQINLQSPANASTLASAPTFTWTADGGTDNAFAVDVSVSPGFTTYYSTYENLHQLIGDRSWTMPDPIWNKVPSDKTLYWRVRGVDLADPPSNIVTSDEVWSFLKTDSVTWMQTFGGAPSDSGESVLTTDGGYVAAGTTSSYGAGSSDLWLIKTDASGNIALP